MLDNNSVEATTGIDVRGLARSYKRASQPRQLHPTSTQPRVILDLDACYLVIGDEPEMQTVRLIEQPLNFGGAQWVAECPECRRACASLYLPFWKSRWLCRTCHGLFHASSLVGRRQRAGLRINKLQQRLGPSPSPAFEILGDRPADMTKKIYDRIAEEICALRAIRDEAPRRPGRPRKGAS